jgi:hypothetical protein
MSELDKTSIPLPFQCYYAARVPRDLNVERVLHTAFGDSRVRASREFFRLDPYRAQAVIELIAIENVTPREDAATDEEGQEAVEKVVRLGGRFNMAKYSIPPGAILEYSSDRSVTCTVVDDTNVDFKGEITSLSKAAVLANRERGGVARALTGPLWWLYEGETLGSIRERLDDEW